MGRRSVEREEFLDDVIITFVEGGPYSWFRVRNYDCSGYTEGTGRPVTAEISVEFTGDGDPPEGCETVVGDYGGEFIFRPWVKLDRNLIAKGLNVTRSYDGLPYHRVCAPAPRTT